MSGVLLHDGGKMMQCQGEFNLGGGKDIACGKHVHATFKRHALIILAVAQRLQRMHEVGLAAVLDNKA